MVKFCLVHLKDQYYKRSVLHNFAMHLFFSDGDNLCSVMSRSCSYCDSIRVRVSQLNHKIYKL